jgi:hypothetical protein
MKIVTLPKSAVLAAAAAVTCLGAPLAQAVETTGTITALRASDVLPFSSGRVSIKMTKPSDVCSNPGWYAYDNANAGVFRIYTDLLTAAYQFRRTVTIFGTGTCDAYGVEKISGIDVK